MSGDPHGRKLLRAAERRIDELAFIVSTPVGEYEVSGSEALTNLLDSPHSTDELVAREFENLSVASGRRTFRGVARWVAAVRPVVLADDAREMSRMDYTRPQVVAAGRMVVDAGGLLERELRARSPRRGAPRLRLLRVRGRGPRRRSTRLSRARRGSPGREPEPDPPPRSGAPRGRGAAA